MLGFFFKLLQRIKFRFFPDFPFAEFAACAKNFKPSSVVEKTTIIIIPLFVQTFPRNFSKSESKLLGKIISNSLQMLNQVNAEIDERKNVIVISADSQSALIGEAASASYHSEGWTVASLGDMSDSIDVMFDLDLQKFLGKVWAKNNGIMIIVIFSTSEEGLKFFAQAVNSSKGKVGKNLNLVLCGDMEKKD